MLDENPDSKEYHSTNLQLEAVFPPRCCKTKYTAQYAVYLFAYRKGGERPLCQIKMS